MDNKKTPSMPDFYKEWLMAQDVILDLEGEVEKFKGALKKYGRHADGCKKDDYHLICTCGFEGIRKALEGKKK